MGLNRMYGATIFVLMCAAYGMASLSDCPAEYGFSKCPRPLIDDPSDTICCIVYDNGQKQYGCCDETLAVWAIVLIVVAILVVIGIAICICACCCGFCACLANCCRGSSHYQTV
ncbi:uncharacterized protein [Ptychodera flava]|uniref:uncharacterized protein n=1 Tax=Ptychodera flava TaxID=63121 RepID=UPI00396A180E